MSALAAEGQERLRNAFDPFHETTCLEADSKLLSTDAHPYLRFSEDGMHLVAQKDLPAFRRILVEPCWLAVRTCADDLTVRRMMPRAVDNTVCASPTFQVLYEWLVTRRLPLAHLWQLLRLSLPSHSPSASASASASAAAAAVQVEDEVIASQSEQDQALSIVAVLGMLHAAQCPTEQELIAAHRQLVARSLVMPIATPLCGASIGSGVYADTPALHCLLSSSSSSSSVVAQDSNCFAFCNILNNCALHIYTGKTGVSAGSTLTLAPTDATDLQMMEHAQRHSRLSDLWATPLFHIHGAHHSLDLDQLFVRMTSCLLPQFQEDANAGRPSSRGIEACVERLALEWYPQRKKKDALTAARKALLTSLVRVAHLLQTGNAEAVHTMTSDGHGRWQNLVLLFCLVQLLKPRSAANDLKWMFDMGTAWMQVFPATASLEVANDAVAAAAEDLPPRDTTLDAPYSLIVGAIQIEAHYNNTLQDKTWFYHLTKAMSMAMGSGLRTT
jgi:hypothetical protein